MDLKEFLKQFTAVEKSAGETADQVAELKKSNETLTALANMTDVEKTFMKTLDEDDAAKFIKASDKQRTKQIEKAKADEDARVAKEEGKDDVTKAIEKATQPLTEALS